MAKIKNVSPFGDLYVPLLGTIVEKNHIVDVSDDDAKILLLQEDNFKPWGEPAKKAQRRAVKEHDKVVESGEGVAPTNTNNPEGADSE